MNITPSLLQLIGFAIRISFPSGCYFPPFVNLLTIQFICFAYLFDTFYKSKTRKPCRNRYSCNNAYPSEHCSSTKGCQT